MSKLEREEGSGEPDSPTSRKSSNAKNDSDDALRQKLIELERRKNAEISNLNQEVQSFCWYLKMSVDNGLPCLGF